MKRFSILAAIVIAILVTTGVFSGTPVFAQTPTPTPTATPRFPPVGGIVEAVDAEASPVGATDSGSSSGTTYALLAGTAAVLVALGTGGWYARRRWLN